MEYISAEEFLKQSDKVQREFKEYFDCETMLFWNNECLVYGRFEDILINTPAITEGPLRKFIEDKTCGISSIYFKCNNIRINIYDNNKGTCIREFENLGDNLLQAYWKVALEIAKEQIQ